jgi:hypothetical protein
MVIVKQPIPIIDPVLREHPRVHRRNLWAVSGTTTLFCIPKAWPKHLHGEEYRVKARLQVTDSVNVAMCPTDKKISRTSTLTYHFGWTEDGRHWVLFGADPDSEEGKRHMNEFPNVLRGIIREAPSIPLENIEPMVGSKIRRDYEDMRRAWLASE